MANLITVNSGTGNITVTTSRSVIGTVANVASANYANFAGTVTTAAQPNITSVGNLTTLTVTGTTTTGNLVVTGNLQVGNLVANNANYANFAGVAYSVNGSNVSGAVANATYALDAGNANIANTAYAVSGANVSGSVANANYSNIAGTAYSVAGANVVGDVSSALSANVANVAYSVAGANVSGSVANANYANIAGTAYSVAVGNVSGIGNIATINLDGNSSNVLRGDGTFSAEAGNLNANYANFAGNAFSVNGANVSGSVANANYANFAGTVLTNAQPNITSVGTLSNLSVTGNISGNIITANVGNISNINFANTYGNYINLTYDLNNAFSIREVPIFVSKYNDFGNFGSSDLSSLRSRGQPGNTQPIQINDEMTQITAYSFAGNGYGPGYIGNGILDSGGMRFVNKQNPSTYPAPTAFSYGYSMPQIFYFNYAGNNPGQIDNGYQINFNKDVIEVNGFQITDANGNVSFGGITTNPTIRGFNNGSPVDFVHSSTGNLTISGSFVGNLAANVANANVVNISGDTNANIINANRYNANGTPGGAYTSTISNIAGCPDFAFSRYSNNQFDPSKVTATRNRGTSGSPAAVQNGDYIFQIDTYATSNTSLPPVGTGGYVVRVDTNDNAGNITTVAAFEQGFDSGRFQISYDESQVTGNLLINGNTNFGFMSGTTFYGANGLAVMANANVTGNLNVNNYAISNVFSGNTADIAGNVNVDGSIVLANTVQIDSPGYYLPYGFSFNGGMPNTDVIFTFNVQGDVTSGGNVISNVALYDAFTGSPLSLSTYAPLLANLSLIPQSVQGVGSYNAALPVLGTISNVDTSNSTITYSNNFNATTTLNVNTGVIAYNTPTDTYFGINRTVFATATATDSTTNEITLDTVDPIDFGAGVGAEIVFVGTSFGNIAANTVYYVDSVVSGNSAITISTSSGGPVHTLTTATGSMTVTQSGGVADTIIPNTTGFYAGPWNTVPTYGNLTLLTNPNFATTPTITIGSLKPVNYNDNPPNDIPGGFIANIQYNQLVGPTVVGTEGAPTLSGRIFDGFGVNGITAINNGTDPNLSGLRTTFATIAYTDGGSDNASITNPGNPTGVQFTTYTGNSTNDPSDYYLRSGRSLGRIAWYASQQVGGQYYANPGTSPYAGIYAQALGDWNDAVNTSLPMVFAFQYSPLNAATGGGTNYQRINRTFLQAANNTTSIGGATNIEFKPLARSNNGTNNRSPSALGNVSINPQTFVDIRGYTAGNAVSNGAGAVLNVTTTASTWNGDVALRLSRTVNNTANMEFKLPVGSANTMTLVDNASGNTLATFTDGYANFTGQLNSLRTYASFYNPNDIAITANTVANLDLPNTYSANGVSIVSNNQITIARPGTYNIQMSLQLTNSDNASEHDFDVWFAKNGTDIADSATQYTVIKNNGKNVVALNFVDTAAANDYYQIRYASQSANISLEAFASQSTPYVRPAIPSAIVTVVPVGA